ncbi:flavin reductase family protein [Enterococcus hulanensis]|uniref:Flavin reductase family protein n=1 Tax=Enterococcus hulanensis TaxID=2559929 RepID=A0ABU3F340_9ENTE|nr:flavin reductase family protein [Enterococcus hulanensis]MDT2601554.1 flavin reductase family protein [Enterococcus hulanensis]MDT2610903.1 flavin reductase family protein [Enterococcus hulanensis]MDT2618308.1 flavin reductase family protein [Enterococcus hulanensis]MDT2629489.1 flavin reductase family protein [Enterococcus hulanensis]MDT2657051.1 flavin reductase family protein [Enterococcus hulanensis]
MLFYSAKELTTKQNYKFLTGSIIPRPIAWITTINQETNVVNAAPFSYFNVVAKELPLVSLSINRNEQQMKDTAHNLLQQKEGVIHLVNDSVLAEMNQSSASLPSEDSELAHSNLTLINSQEVAVPAIQEAPIRLEVRLHQYVPVNDNAENIISDLFILEVLNYYFKEEIFDQAQEYIDPIKFDPLARLAGNTYGHIARTLDKKRPK